MKPLSLRGEQMKAAGVAASSGPASCGAPPGSMESELLGYRQKTEQMSTLIRHYQSQLESQKVQRDGVETVSRLLTECRQENAALKKQHAALQMAVKSLQNRLGPGGALAGSEVEDNEVILPGTSRQTLTNLALENKRLRSLLLQQEGGSDRSDCLQKTAEDPESDRSPQQTVAQLEAENQSLKTKLQNLEGLFRSSNDAKDRQLIHCQEELQRLASQKGTPPASSKTVAGVTALREQLKVLVTECASFESRLAGIREPEAEKLATPTGVAPPVSKQAAETSDSVDGADVQQLLEDKQKLQARVEEVTQMNRRWQEYFNDRDRYTKALEQKVQDLESQLQEALHRGTSAEVGRQVEQVLEKSRKEAGQAEDRRKKVEEEAQRLSQELAVRDAQLSRLQSQVTLLTQAARQQSPLEAQGVVEHLKAQIQVCTEDFEKERQDRQVALQKVASLQEQNIRLQKLANHLQTLVSQTTRPIVQEHGHCNNTGLLHNSRFPYGQSLLAHDSPSSLSHHENLWDYPDCDQESTSRELLPLQAPGPVSLPATTMELLSRGSHKPRHSLSDSALSSEASRQDSVLTCPKCSREFSEERQGELLTHMDVCWE